MSLINVTNLTFAYDGGYSTVFENVSFQIDTDWKLGFTGRNGRGKTTFLNLLLGKYDYSGTISSSVDFEYFPYEVEDKSMDTISILRNICPKCMEWEICRETSILEVDPDALYRPFSTLSCGEQTKTLLAALFLNANSFLLIDEPTNHLDAEAGAAVGNYLKRKQGFILVSHNRALLDACVDHILSINKRNIEIQKGNFSTWWANKQLQDNFELAENEKLKQDIVRLSVAVRRNANWSDIVERSKNSGKTKSGLKPDKGYVGHKAAKMMKRSKVIEARKRDAITNKSKLLRNIEQCDSLKLCPLLYHSERLIEFNGVSLFYGDKTVCEDISFEVMQGDRIALSGKNGSGKSSILKLICGEQIAYSGTVFRASGLKISYVSQETSYLHGSLSEYANMYGIDETLFKSTLHKLDFERIQFEKNMEDFSGGQKKKVLIARSLCEQAHLYIWDEPLNFIDVISRIQIEELLLTYKPTLMFVEHDILFNENIAVKTVKV
ncbi:MAG: ABC-F type ribosomal protection protein [Synergistaceae bacterium]|nr:ABC-F type ribosomal protection protein [Synergistaceae bacterium]